MISFAAGQTLPTGSAVNSLNSLTGGVTLAAGSNVSITPNGNTLTIGSMGLSIVRNDGTLAGAGTSQNPLGIKIPMSLGSVSAMPTISAFNLGGDGVVGNSTGGDGVNGNSTSPDKSGVYSSNSANGGFGVFGRNTFDGSTGYLGAVGVGVTGSSLSITGDATIAGGASVRGA